MEVLSSTIISMAMQAAIQSGSMYEAVGEYKFSPQISQYEACQHAEYKAKQLIVRAATGQSFLTEQSQQCIDRSGSASCDTYSHTMESDGGYINKVADREEVVQDWTCYVRVKASVKSDVDRKKHDPSFDFSVALNKLAFISGDEITFAVQPNAQMYLYVYHYDPYTAQFTKIFPNNRDHDNLIQPHVESTFPRTGYRFRVSVPNSMSRSAQQLVFVTTQSEQNLNNSYHVAEFTKTVDNLNTKKRIVRKGFNVMKGEL